MRSGGIVILRAKAALRAPLAKAILTMLCIALIGLMLSLLVVAVAEADMAWPLKIISYLLIGAWASLTVMAMGLRQPVRRYGWGPEPKEVHWTPDPIIAYRLTVSPLGNRGEYRKDMPATCRIGENHRSPVWDCTCGYYAFSEYPKDAYGSAAIMWGDDGQYYPLILLCLMWGRVIQCERGYRSEYMAPVAWLVPNDCGKPASLTNLGGEDFHYPFVYISDTTAIHDHINRVLENLDISQYQPYDKERHGHRKPRS